MTRLIRCHIPGLFEALEYGYSKTAPTYEALPSHGCSFSAAEEFIDVYLCRFLLGDRIRRCIFRRIAPSKGSRCNVRHVSLLCANTKRYRRQ